MEGTWYSIIYVKIKITHGKGEILHPNLVFDYHFVPSYSRRRHRRESERKHSEEMAVSTVK